MRAGPGLGYIYPAQGDYNQAVYGGGNGDPVGWSDDHESCDLIVKGYPGYGFMSAGKRELLAGCYSSMPCKVTKEEAVEYLEGYKRRVDTDVVIAKNEYEFALKKAEKFKKAIEEAEENLK